MDTRWRPMKGNRRLSGAGPTHSAWSLDDDLGQLQKTMLSLLTDPALSDVCLVVEGVEVPAHKAILAAWSRPFRAMFTLPMLESQHQCKVVIKDAEEKHLMVVLEYLYTGRIGLNDQNVMPVSALANRYEILPLMTQCEGYMKWRLNPSNVCRHLLAAEDHQCGSMAAFALDYLAVHFDEVHHDSSGDFNALAGDTVLRVLQHEGLTVDEETVFLAVDAWAKSWRRRRAMRGACSTAMEVRFSPPSGGNSVTDVKPDRGIRNSESRETSKNNYINNGARSRNDDVAGIDDRSGRSVAREHNAVRIERPSSGGVRGQMSEVVTANNNGSSHPQKTSCRQVSSAPGVNRSSASEKAAAAALRRRNSSAQGSLAVGIPGTQFVQKQQQHSLEGAASTGDVEETAASATSRGGSGMVSVSRCSPTGAPEETATTASRAAAAAAAAAAASSSSGDEHEGLRSAPFTPERTTQTNAAVASVAPPVCGGRGGGRGHRGRTRSRGQTAGDDAARAAPESAGSTPDAVVLNPAADAGGPGRWTTLPGLSSRFTVMAVDGSGPNKVETDEDLGGKATAGVGVGVGVGAGVGVGVGKGGGGRGSSVSLPPPTSESLMKMTGWSAPPRAPGDVGRVGALGRGSGSGSFGAGLEQSALEVIPEEERAVVDELFREVRFPLISTSFLCQVVEKSPAFSSSGVAKDLLHEAYRFQAFQALKPDPTEVDEHFSGIHRVKHRGHERVLFGEGDGCVGTVDDYSSSLSEVHLVGNVQRRDEKYWLPGQPEEAYVCIRLDRVRRITKFRFQNRYSEEFEVAVRRTRREEWQVIVPRQPSGGHKDVTELDLTGKRVKARHVKISLRGRKRSCYNTSVYWTELLGF